MTRPPAPAPGRPPFTNPARAVLAMILLGTAVRIVLAATIGLGVDESYMVAVARPVSASYFDHPPLSFWIPAAVAHLGGGMHPLALRLPFILFFAATTWLTFRVGALLFGEQAGALGAVLLNLSPVFSVTTGGWILPDGPLMCFMMATVLALAHALLDPAERRTGAWWLAAGVFSALAMLSKYHAVFLLAGTALFLVTDPERRIWLRRPAPWIAVAIALAGLAPVVLWNAAHHWVSFRFQGGRASPAGVHPLALLASLGGQAGYVLPWIWVPLVVVWVGALRRGPRDPARWLLCCIASGPIFVFTLPSLGGHPGLPHWEAPGYLLLFPLLGAAAAARWADGAQRVRRWLLFSAVAFGVLLLVAATQSATGWMERVWPRLATRGDPTLEMLDWSDLRGALAARGLLDRPGLFVAAPGWSQAGKAAYALGPEVPVLCLCTAPHQFGYVHDQRDFLGHDAVIVDRTQGRSAVPELYGKYFAAIDSLGAVELRRNGRPAERLALFYARDFERPYPMQVP